MFIAAEEKNSSIINLEDKFKTAFYEKGTVLPTQRPGLWLISSGIIQLETVHENATKVVLGWAKPGRFVGNW
ncbi:MAG: hypothetical protein ACFBSE_16800 [Prochloraceae cyanobacterium]